MFKKYTYELNSSKDIWTNETFDTIDECIEDAKNNYDLKIGDKIYVGETESIDSCIDSIDYADRIIGMIQEQVWDTVGEVSEDYLNDITKEQEKQLNDKLVEVINTWLKETNNEPKYYNIISIQEVEII